MNEVIESIDDRAHHSYKILWELRNKSSWGHLPPNTEMFDFFDSIKTHTGTVHNILEFGTNVGFSAMMQLQVNPEASLTSFDIQLIPLNCSRTRLKPLKGMSPLTEIENTSSQVLLSLIYGGRFHYKIFSSAKILQYPRICETRWSYVFIDGGHYLGEAVTDIDNAIRHLDTDYILVDNMLMSGVSRAAEIFEEKGLIEPVAEHYYYQTKYGSLTEEFYGSPVADKLVLYKKTYK